MRNYYETLAYADREDLLVERTMMNIYIGFKDGENSKTLFELPEDKGTIRSMLSELKNTKYKESNLYKLLAETIVKNEINNLDPNCEMDIAMIGLERLVNSIDYKLTKEDYDDIEKNADVVYYEEEKCFCHKSYYKKKKMLSEIISSKKIHITDENIDDVRLILPRYNQMIEEIDDDIMNDTFYYEYYHYSDTKLYDSYYYCALYDDISSLLNMLKSKEVEITYDNQKLKDEMLMKVFWEIQGTAELLNSHNGEDDFTKEHLNYYNTFYDGKVLL